MGGAIRGLDPVRDQFTLKISGGGSVKILFDERTRLYRDGVKTSLRELSNADQASIETVLDGTKVYALGIHLLSEAPEGEIEGQVVHFNSDTAELVVESRLSAKPLRLHVPAGTPVVCVGQAAGATCMDVLSSERTKGALVSIKFRSDNTDIGVATRIEILATPGSTYVLSGDLAALDLHAGLMVLVDPRDNQSYTISFDSTHLPASRDLHEGMYLAVSATFDGSHYVADSLTARRP